jgi:hypothetical protein
MPDSEMIPHRTLAFAKPVVRSVMRLVLSEEDFATAQIIGFQIESRRLEATRAHANYMYYVEQIKSIIESHLEHTRTVRRLKLRYAEQIIMWGFECSKPEADWDPRFIERRRLYLAQLNGEVRQLAIAFEDKIGQYLLNERAWPTARAQLAFLQVMQAFRAGWELSLKAAMPESVPDRPVPGARV